MAKKKVKRKELLKTTDEFVSLSARTINFVHQHSREFTSIGIAIAAIVLIYLGITTYQGYMNKKGQEAYNLAFYTLMKNINVNADTKKLGQSGDLFQKVKDHYGSSKAGRLALSELAYIRFMEKKYDEAISLYLDFLKTVSDDMTYQSLACIALASCYEAKGDFEKAIDTLKRVISGPDNYIKEQAMLGMARVFSLAHQDQRAIEVLKEFAEKFKASPYLPLVKAHLSKFP